MTERGLNRGAVVSVRDSAVVDVRFNGGLPPIYSVLRAGTDGRIIIEVMAQLEAQCVRGVALTCERILLGEFESYPEGALYMIGAIAEAGRVDSAS